MKSCKCITHSVMIFSLLTYSSASVSICPTRSVPVSTSGFIESPGYPESYNSAYRCTLTLTLPASSEIVFSVNGTYKVHGKFFGGCSTLDYLKLVTNETTVDLCGEKRDKEVLARFETNTQPATMHLKFRAGALVRLVDGAHIFQINYTVAEVSRKVSSEVPSSSPKLIPSSQTQKIHRARGAEHSKEGDTSIENIGARPAEDNRMKIFLIICGGFVMLVGIMGGLLIFSRRSKSSANRSSGVTEQGETLNRLSENFTHIQGDRDHQSVPETASHTRRSHEPVKQDECATLNDPKFSPGLGDREAHGSVYYYRIPENSMR